MCTQYNGHSVGRTLRPLFTIIPPMGSTSITPELRAQILSSIKDEGTSIADAAKHHASLKTRSRDGFSRRVDNAHTSMGELQRLRRENQVLKEIIDSLVLEREAGNNNLTRSLARAARPRTLETQHRARVWYCEEYALPSLQATREA